MDVEIGQETFSGGEFIGDNHFRRSRMNETDVISMVKYWLKRKEIDRV